MDTASREGGGLRSHWWVGLLGTFGVVGIGVGVVGLVLGVGALWWAMRPVEAPSAPPLAAGAPVAAPIGPAPSTPTEPPPEAAGPAADDPPAEPAAPEDPATSTKPSTGAAASTSKRPTATASSTVATSTAPVETSGPTSAAVAAVGAEHQVQAPPDTAIRVTCKGRDGDQLKVNGVAKGTIPARVDLEKGKYTLTIVGLKGQSQVDYTFLEADKGTTVEVCHGLGPPTQSVGLNETDLPSASGIPKPPAGQGMVCVYRPPSLTGAALRTWVYLDNVELGSLANGRYSCGPAAPGTHRVLVAAPGVRETHPASSSGANASFELLKGGVQFVRVNVVTATTAQLTLTGEDAFSVSGAKESKWTK
jgi:hypothetical protein